MAQQNHHHHPHQLNSSPDPTPHRSRARKPTKPGPNGPKKQCQRGKGVAELERLLRQQQQQQQQIQSTPEQQQQQLLLHQANPLAGVPVHPGRLPHFGLSAQRLGPTDNQYPRFALGFPDQHLQRYLDDVKKKRMMMGELGFMNGPSGTHLGGAYNDMNMFNNGDNGNTAYYLALNSGVSQPNHVGGSEVMAIHKKGNGSTIVMMKEYEFFPEVKEDSDNNLNLNLGITTTTATTAITTTTTTTGHYTSNIINNNYHNTPNYEVVDYMLNLQMCGLDPDHSSSSSLSSLSDPPPTATVTATAAAATTNGRLDLSLRL